MKSGESQKGIDGAEDKLNNLLTEDDAEPERDIDLSKYVLCLAPESDIPPGYLSLTREQSTVVSDEDQNATGLGQLVLNSVISATVNKTIGAYFDKLIKFYSNKDIKTILNCLVTRMNSLPVGFTLQSVLDNIFAVDGDQFIGIDCGKCKLKKGLDSSHDCAMRSSDDIKNNRIFQKYILLMLELGEIRKFPLPIKMNSDCNDELFCLRSHLITDDETIVAGNGK